MKRFTHTPFALALLALAGCEPSSAIRTGPEEADAPEVVDDGGIGGRSTLGRGYDVFANYADPLDVTRPVLDYDALVSAGLIDAFETSTSRFEVFEGSSLEEFSRQMSATAKVSGSSGPFSGSVEASFAQGTRSRMEYSYASLQFLNLKRQLQILETQPEELRAFLTGVARRDIDDASFSADTLLDEYGTHVLLDVLLGGRLDYSMASDLSDVSSDLSLGVAIQASYKGVVQSGSASLESALDVEVREVEENSSFQTIARGGRSEIVGNTLTEERVDAWLETIDAEPVLVAFSDNRPMIPLWELASDPARAEEIEAAFQARALGLSSSLQDGPARFAVTLSISIPPGGANNDEGRGDLEIYGTVAARSFADVATATADDAEALQEEILFDRTGGGDFIVVDAGETIEIGTAILDFDAFDEASSGIVFESHIRERDPGRSGDDDLGREVRSLQFRTPSLDADGEPFVELLVGRHVVSHGRGVQVDMIYDVQLLD